MTSGLTICILFSVGVWVGWVLGANGWGTATASQTVTFCDPFEMMDPCAGHFCAVCGKPATSCERDVLIDDRGVAYDVPNGIDEYFCDDHGPLSKGGTA